VVDVDVCTQGVGDVALAVGDLHEVPHAILSGPRRNEDARAQDDADEAEGRLLLEHDALGLVVVGDHLDPRTCRDGKKGQQLARSGGQDDELLRVEVVRSTQEGLVG